MTTKGRNAAPRQALSEKGNVRLGVMMLMMLMVVGMAAGQPCARNLDCGRNTCIAGSCAVKSVPGGPCDTNDKADCSNTGSICSASNTCQSPVGGQCLANNQCVSPGVCIAKRCKAALSDVGGPCDDAGDCATVGSTCSGSVCVDPSGPTCADNNGCTSPEVCIGNQCLAQSAPEGPCDEGADCSVTGSTCPNGKCLSPNEGVCFTNAGCTGGLVCIGGECTGRSPAGGPCDTNNPGDCAVAGSTCTNNICFSPAGTSCGDNTECASPNTCLGGVCRAKSSATGVCEEPADCAVIGSTCSLANRCVSPTGGACSSNAGCQSTQVCVSQRCVNKASPGGSCDESTDCSIAGSTCSAGACTSPSGALCTANRHCTSGSDVCVAQTCVARRDPGESCDETADCIAGATCVKAFCRLPNGADCGTNNDACTPPSTCLDTTCKAKSAVLGDCDDNDGADCVISGSTCETNVCKSPIGAPCNTNSFCSSPNTCFRNVCRAKSAPSGPCDSNDADDCSVPPSSCINNICRSLTNAVCSANSDCAASTDSCIGGTCLAKSLVGQTCDLNDDADCRVRNSVCSSGTCLSPFEGPCGGNGDCAAGTCVGGFCETTPPNLLWSGHASLPIPLEEFSAVAVGNSIWVMGGFNLVTGVASRRVFEYDTMANTWTERTPLPVVSYTHAAVYVTSRNSIYVIGGRTSQASLHNRVLKYDINGNDGMGSVVQLVPLLPGGFGLLAHSAVVMTDPNFGSEVIFTFGGLSDGVINLIFYLDTAGDNNEWQVGYENPDPVNDPCTFNDNVLPQPITYTTASVFNGLVYIMGGNIEKQVVDFNVVFDPNVSVFTIPSFCPSDESGAAVRILEPLRSPRYFHSSFVYGNSVFVVGGASSSDLASYLVTIDEYNPATNTWTSLTNPLALLPSERVLGQAVLVNNRVYYIGGRSTSTVGYVEVFDLLQREWVQFKAVPVGTQGAAVVAVGTDIVVASGTDRLGQRQTATQIYDTVNNLWTQGDPVPLAVVNGLGVTDGSFLYLIGGSFLQPATAASSSTVSVTNKVQVYDVADDLWIPDPSLPEPMPLPRRQACGAYDPVSGKVFVFGGTDISGRAFNTTQVFSVADGTWTTLPSPMPSAIRLCSAILLGSKIYVVGGRDEVNALRSQILSFDVVSGMWDKTVYPEVTVFENPQLAIIDDFIIITGGGVSTNPAIPSLRTAYAFDPASRAVFPLPTAPTARYNGGAANVGGQIFFVGGRSADNIITSVEVLG